ncbi:60S ribosomal export protein nmd3 [Protomyces lactucae-debilis]|uniref:60S ribosomal export protein NMD3 n=1 Tax=Protomyces lactucae-debilis TaxID=2754530 RepID=A0A1Y2F2K7_PROLT|nr:60S ribosomal export protein nmd3 [Protomyces lactucae-debilis]ORY78120.1 60S ribosomal export protein nmd3 [Protomyces lactucae-debilis]
MDGQGTIQGYYNAAPTEATILCCSCATPIAPNPAAMCMNCIKMNTDITEGIPREGVINFCRDCERYLLPPMQWVRAQPESRELLALCLKKIRGLNKVRLIDAKFRWTEPHSRRIKVILTIQKEAFTSTILQQTFEVEFSVGYQQCPECAKTFTHHTWKACVQIRQKVSHKRTFLYLEQLILKHHAHKDAMSIKEVKDGLDFYFSNKNQALKMVEFLHAVVPVNSRTSEELVSADRKNGIANFKFTFSVELVPICKDDLVCLPKATAKALSNISQLVLAYKVSNSVHFIDPQTLHTADMSTAAYWRNPFKTLADVKDMVEFTVLDVEITGQVQGKYALADIEVVRSSGTADQTFFARSHLGAILQPGDTVMGFHLAVTNSNDTIFDELRADDIPDVILVRKSYQNRRKKSKARNWKLKTLSKAAEEEDPKKGKKQDQSKFERDYEQFLQELEEDEELRHTVNLYKDEQKKIAESDSEMETDDEGDELPEIGVDELLDEMEEMNIRD